MTLTREPQYQALLDNEQKHGRITLGLMTSQIYQDDPRLLAIKLARYKFAAKMLAGKHQVLEVGCGDGFLSRIVQQTVTRLTAVDFDPLFVEEARAQGVDVVQHDMVEDGGAFPTFDAVFAVDVLEHIPPGQTDPFMRHICGSLTPQGVCLMGMPSFQSQAYASAQSKAGHVNCMGGYAFRAFMARYFHNVFMFGMNDEVVHTGFFPMCHYLWALGVGVK